MLAWNEGLKTQAFACLLNALIHWLTLDITRVSTRNSEHAMQNKRRQIVLYKCPYCVSSCIEVENASLKGCTSMRRKGLQLCKAEAAVRHTTNHLACHAFVAPIRPLVRDHVYLVAF